MLILGVEPSPIAYKTIVLTDTLYEQINTSIIFKKYRLLYITLMKDTIRQQQDSNLRANFAIDFKSISLTTRTCCH